MAFFKLPERKRKRVGAKRGGMKRKREEIGRGRGTRNGEEVQWRKNEGRKGLKNKQVATARSFAPREAQVQQKVSRGSGLSVPS